MFNKLKTPTILIALTAGALLVQGYHPYAEDAEIYLPGVEKILHPELFPVGQEFFKSHASMTLFPNLIAFSIRLTHLPFAFGIFVWQVVAIFLLLTACWELARVFFPRKWARWGGVSLVAALLTIPVSGTALYIMDQYLNPRNLAAFAAIFAVTRTVEKKYLRALAWVIFAAAVHPLMWVFPFSFCVLYVVLEKLEGRWRLIPSAGGAAALFIVPIFIMPIAIMAIGPVASRAYDEAARLHGHHYIQNWEWYELLGIVGPLILFWWFGRIARKRQWSTVERVSRAFIVYGLIYLVMAMALDLPRRFEELARIQPLRSSHLSYIVLFLMIGGFLGEYVLRNHLWRWLILFLPLCAGMFLAQRSLFPASAHVEWPGAAPKNPWEQAFVWARGHTPEDAVFAIDPNYMSIVGEDEVGFRCLAQRSRLADAVKDNGVVSMFPALADGWWAQVQAQTPWEKFGVDDFLRLKSKYGVSWVVVQQPGVQGLDCAYQNSVVLVCRIP